MRGVLHRITRVAIAAGAGCALGAVSAAAYEGGPVTNGGTIAGSVRVIGAVTPLPPQPVQKHVEECGKTVRDERLVVGPNGALGNVIVRLLDVDHGKPLPTGPVVLLNHKCAFVPHVLTACVGQTLELVNQDPFLHDAHAWLGDRTLFNLAIPRGRTVHAHLQDGGLIQINCNVRHTWMHAFLFVGESPYLAVTDATGHFTITEVPAGTYHLHVWHEILGSADREVTVGAGGTTNVDVGLAATAPGPPTEQVIDE